MREAQLANNKVTIMKQDTATMLCIHAHINNGYAVGQGFSISILIQNSGQYDSVLCHWFRRNIA
jgi:hypothetical protein